MHLSKSVLAALLLQASPLMAQTGTNEPFICTLGFGAAYAPVYEGSNKSKAVAFPQFNVSFQNDTFFAGTSGIGFRAINSDQMSLSLAVGYGGERKVKDDVANLAGMGDIKGQALALISAEYHLGVVSVGADVSHGKSYGTTVKMNVSAGTEIADGLSIGGVISATYADKDHMGRYFGVNAAQSAASGKGVYSPNAGFKSAGIAVQAAYAISDTSTMTLGISYDRLMGDAGRSALTRDRSQKAVFLGMTTRF